jgi:hypothetical protein
MSSLAVSLDEHAHALARNGLGMPQSGEPRVYRFDSCDGPDLVLVCREGHASPTLQLSATDNTTAAAHRLMEAGCEACRMDEEARSRGRAVADLVARGVLRVLEVI